MKNLRSLPVVAFVFFLLVNLVQAVEEKKPTDDLKRSENVEELKAGSKKSNPTDQVKLKPGQLRNLAFEETEPDFTFPARKKRYFYQGWRKGKCVALTFDDGPNPIYTAPLLALLRKKKVPATFFLLGQNVKDHPHIVRQIVESGCEVANHSFTHPNMRKISVEKIREELVKTQKEIEKISGVTPRCLRLPYGISSQDVARLAYENHLDILYWSIDTNDWKKDVTKKDIVKRVLNDVEGGSIILMHDKSRKVLESVEDIIDPIHERGFEFVTCSELVHQVRLNRYMEKKENQKDIRKLKP